MGILEAQAEQGGHVNSGEEIRKNVEGNWSDPSLIMAPIGIQINIMCDYGLFDLVK